ncbi:MAG: NirD/YgiW/YdeI family stress tolerance protein [Spirochaetaceae bacterium]|nr:NirD/YgiW/YdeI family stress tolerance protein [Spirochaetaceae bacterium]
MKKIILLSLVLLLTSGIGLVAQTGFTGPSNQGQNVRQGQSVTVAQAHTMRDDSRVVLTGHIISHISGNYYLFRDSTGEIRVEIYARRWNGLQVGPGDLVEISGEVDQGRNRPAYIEVYAIRLL